MYFHGAADNFNIERDRSHRLGRFIFIAPYGTSILFLSEYTIRNSECSHRICSQTIRIVCKLKYPFHLMNAAPECAGTPIFAHASLSPRRRSHQPSHVNTISLSCEIHWCHVTKPNLEYKALSILFNYQAQHKSKHLSDWNIMFVYIHRACYIATTRLILPKHFRDTHTHTHGQLHMHTTHVRCGRHPWASYVTSMGPI